MRSVFMNANAVFIPIIKTVSADMSSGVNNQNRLIQNACNPFGHNRGADDQMFNLAHRLFPYEVSDNSSTPTCCGDSCQTVPEV